MKDDDEERLNCYMAERKATDDRGLILIHSRRRDDQSVRQADTRHDDDDDDDDGDDGERELLGDPLTRVD